MANVTQNAPVAGEANLPNTTSKGKAKKKTREKRPISALRAALIVLVAMLFLLTLASTVVYMNWFDAKQFAVNILLEGKSPYDPQIQRLEEIARSIAQENLALEQARADLEAREMDVAKALQDVQAREEALVTRSSALDDRVARVENFEGNMEQLAAIYQTMDPVRAAGICEEIYDSDDIARLLAHMEQTNASNILAAMTPARAARVTELLMEE